jgi:photosystem II stability/assembly factor-like uncharacterized protein
LARGVALVTIHMFSKRILALTLFAALAVMPPCVLRAQWVQTNGQYGGEIGAITVSGNNIFALDVTYGNLGGVFISSDTGRNWNLFSLSGNVVQYVAGCGAYLFAWTQDSFYVSKNNGRTWIEDSNRTAWIDSSYIPSFSTFVQANSNIFAGGVGVSLSTDSGISWTKLNSSQNDITALALSGTNLYALYNEDSIFRSTNGGNSWAPANHGLPSDSGRQGYGTVYCLATIGTNLFVGTDNGVYLSTDSGNNYIMVDTAMPYDTWSLTSNGTNLFAATLDRGIFMSIDSGANWTQHGLLEPEDEEFNSIAVMGSNIFVGTENGLYRSTDTTINGTLVGLPCIDIYSFFASGSNLFINFANSDLLSIDGGISWNSVDDGTFNFSTYIPTYNPMLDGSILFGAADSGGMLISVNNGLSWSESSLPLNMKYFSAVRLGEYLFVGSGTYPPTPTTVYRSSDSGETWTSTSEGIPTELYGFVSVLTNDRLLYTGTSSGSANEVFYESSDLGQSWHLVDTNGLCCPAPIPVARIGSTIIGIGSGELYSTTDNGSNWELMDSDSQNDSLTGINSAVATSNNLFVCAKNGNIFLSTDTGVTWKNVNDGLVDSSISFLAVTGQYLFAANTNDSFWRCPLGDFGIAAVTQINPLQNSLKSYPNPFTQSTQITFTSQTAGYAHVSIVNMLGVEVARLFSGELDAGEHSFMWGNPTGLPDGTYECLVRMNGQVETLPILLLR